MWRLEKVTAQNLCAFQQLDYTLLQGHTTLIFGNNMDNDSQGSNGSGKSAMLEAIAIGLTGETLRKIKMEEIINDAADTASVKLLMSNDSTNECMEISRELSRKSAQIIKIGMGTKNEPPVNIEQATVADYNKFILETLGLTKGDIFANFILSKHKYLSFLSSSDRDKKEIINRFSNGVLVDESIMALQNDMLPVQQELQDAETRVAVLNGKVDTLQEQINNAITESTEKSQKKAERIANWRNAITEKRAYIRTQTEESEAINDMLERLDKQDESLQNLEQGTKDMKDCYQLISKQYAELSLPALQDRVAIFVGNQDKLVTLEQDYKDLHKQLAANNKKLTSNRESFDKLTARYEKFNGEYDKKADKIQQQINKLMQSINTLEHANDDLKQQRTNLERDIAKLQQQLAGVIICPQCQHKFTLKGDVNIEETKLQLQDRQGEVADILKTISSNESEIATCIAKEKETRRAQTQLAESKADWSAQMTEAQTQLDQLTRETSAMNNRLQGLQSQAIAVQKSIETARTHLFDEAYEVLDNAIKMQEGRLKQIKINIDNANGAIQSYEESIRDIEHAVETNIIDSLKASKERYEKELGTAIADKEQIEQRLNDLKVQESTFVEFKTHLANTKIDALSHITNEFLEAIGSDIRIVFSGYTVLKSGKIRDKISISLIRDGIDCGSFDKFSEGEKARVNLANILAMHKLTNTTCDDDKGLDLLILDEILEATDEQGLANIFDALNQLQITALVVSHGNIAESYPYKTVVNKLNGVSYVEQ